MKIFASFRRMMHRLYSALFERGDAVPVLISLITPVLMAVAAYLSGTYGSYERVVLYEVGGTSTALFAILLSSIAILLAISEGTLKLSRKNTKWFSNFSSITNKLKRPVILALSLAALAVLVPPIVTMVGTETYVSVFLTVLLLSANIYLIILTGDVMMRMLAHIRASVGHSLDEEAGRSYIISINDRPSCLHEINRTQNSMRSFTGLLLDALEKIKQHEPGEKRTPSTQNIISDIGTIMSNIQDFEHTEEEYDHFLSNHSEQQIDEYHDLISKSIIAVEKGLTEAKKTFAEVDQIGKDIKEYDRASALGEIGRAKDMRNKAIYNISKRVRQLENTTTYVNNSFCDLKNALKGENI